MLFVILTGLELAFDLLVIEAVAPLFAASPAVENQIGGDLITVAVLAGRQEAEQVTAQVGEAQLFVQFLLLLVEQLLLLLHFKQAAEAGFDGVT